MNTHFLQNPSNPQRLQADLRANLREAMHGDIAMLIWHAESVLRYLHEGDDTGLAYAYRRMREHDLVAAHHFADLFPVAKGGSQ